MKSDNSLNKLAIESFCIQRGPNYYFNVQKALQMLENNCVVVIFNNNIIIFSLNNTAAVTFNVQWLELNGITDNVINQIMGSNYPSSQVPNYSLVP